MKVRTICTWAVVVLLKSTLMADAVIDIAWAATSGFYPAGSTDDSIGILDASTTGSVLVHLLFNESPTRPIPSPVHPFMSGMPWDPQDQVVASFILSGTGYGDFSAPNYQRPFVAGWVWGRIFSSADPGPGDWYWDGPIVAAAQIPPLATPQGYDLNLNTAPFPFGGDILNFYILPEPGTLTFMVFGVVGAWATRRRQLQNACASPQASPHGHRREKSSHYRA